MGFGHPDPMYFPHAILRQLCTGLWRDLLGMSISELRSAICETPGDIKLRDTAQQKVIELYRLVRLEDERLLYSRKNGVGASLGIKADLSEKKAVEWSTSPLLSSEVIDLITELLEDVAQPKGINQFVMLCDEANLMSFSEQKDLLLRFVELFASNNTQFAMVMRPEPVAQAQAVFSGCERVELKGFSERKYVGELIEKHLHTTEIDVTEDGIDVLWEVFSGNPLDTLVAASIGFDEASRKQKSFIDGPIMAVASAKHLRLIKESERFLVI